MQGGDLSWSASFSSFCSVQLAHVSRSNYKLQGQVDQLEAELAKSSAAVAELRAEKAELQCVAAAAAARATVASASIASQMSQKDQVRSRCSLRSIGCCALQAARFFSAFGISPGTAQRRLHLCHRQSPA